RSIDSRSKITLMFFFFSSRRRHTRSYGDWSSDVCLFRSSITVTVASEFSSAAMSSIAAELNSLATVTVIDFYRRWVRPEAPDAQDRKSVVEGSRVEDGGGGCSNRHEADTACTDGGRPFNG